jgi:hypothetical protein
MLIVSTVHVVVQLLIGEASSDIKWQKGVAACRYPHVEPIWQAYLTSFVDRHKGGKLERARDLFSQVQPAVCC